MGRFRPEVEAELAYQPAAPENLNHRQRRENAQPCILCGAPISGRAYASAAVHRAVCKVMAALVQEDCLIAFLDLKDIYSDWRALRQVIPEFGQQNYDAAQP